MRHKSKKIKLFGLILACLAGSGVQVPETQAQVLSGGASLKIPPGLRYQGAAGTYDGVMDDMHALLVNPGATGLLREMHWATNYTEWLVDSYSFSGLYGWQLRTPLNKKTRLALGFNYLGVREFNSTGNPDIASVSANDILGFASIGTPVSFISDQLSFGANVKYLHSNLEGIKANSIMVDLGMLYRLKLKVGYLSLGGAISQLGQSLNYIQQNSPLPRSYRAGVALNFGSHNGLQFQVTTDLQKIQHEKTTISVGAEASLNYRYALRVGNRFNSEQLSNLNFGVTLNLDGLWPGSKTMGKRNSSARADAAYLEGSDIFDPPLRIGFTGYSRRPEKFEFVEPAYGAEMRDMKATLKWETSRDPDLYDEVGYTLMIERAASDTLASSILADFVAGADSTPDNFNDYLSKHRNKFYAVQEIPSFEGKQIEVAFSDLPGGIYYWSVLAHDLDGRSRFAEKDGRKIWKFEVWPDLMITNIQFAYNHEITEDSLQGKIQVDIANMGAAKSDSVDLNIYDQLVRDMERPKRVPNDVSSKNGGHGHNGHNGNDSSTARESVFRLPEIAPGDTITYEFEWQTRTHGGHRIGAFVDELNNLGEPERQRANNEADTTFYTIPKGKIYAGTEQTRKRALILRETVFHFDLAFLRKIFFERNSDEIPAIHSPLMYSLLDTLAHRLRLNPDIYIMLQGAYDESDGEPRSLAFSRARAVEKAFREGLRNRGLTNKVEVDREVIVFKESPRRSPDIEKVREERRYVQINARYENGEDAVSLFNPVSVSLPRARSYFKIPFTSTIYGAIAPVADNSHLYLEPIDRPSAQSPADSVIFARYATVEIDTLQWRHNKDRSGNGLDRDFIYRIQMKDELGRTFHTQIDSVRLISLARRPLFTVGAPQFRSTSLKPDFSYLEEQLENRRKELELERNLRHTYGSLLEELDESAEGGGIMGDHICGDDQVPVTDAAENQIKGRLIFVGHACSIGSDKVNERYSLQRAKLFSRAVQTTIKKMPDLRKMADLSFEAIGHGEKKPFRIELDEKEFFEALNAQGKLSQEEIDLLKNELHTRQKRSKFYPFILERFTCPNSTQPKIRITADNDSPYGRQINRRIEIRFKPASN